MAISRSRSRNTAREQVGAADDVLIEKICARRNALMAQWATTVLDLDDAQSYADELARAAASGDAGLLTRIREDFRAAGIEIIDEVLQDRMVALLRSAAAELRRLEPNASNNISTGLSPRPEQQKNPCDGAARAVDGLVRDQMSN